MLQNETSADYAADTLLTAITSKVIAFAQECGSISLMAVARPPLSTTLQGVRKARRLSQLALGLELGVSQRHISFVESGRSRPSRELLLAWLAALDAPLALSNEALLQAGYAPAYSATPLDDPALGEINEALNSLLAAHDPMPAMVLDADWNLLSGNRGTAWLASSLMPWTAGMIGQEPINLLDLLVHPEGMGGKINNLAEVGPTFLNLIRREAAAHPSLWPRVEAYQAFLDARLGKSRALDRDGRPAAPVLTTHFQTDLGELRFFSMFSTFGTPQDITLASLRVEHMFPADPPTRQRIEQQILPLPLDR